MSDVEAAQYFFGKADGTAGILYDSALMPTQISFGNNTSQTIARDPMHRIRSITSSAGATAFWSTGTYRYDGAGNIRNIGVSSESGFGVTVGAQEYWYDAVNRLVQAQTASQVNSSSGASTTTAYSYDLFGNMLSHQRTAGATVPTGYDWSNRTYSGNRATNHGYLYDSNGNTLRIIDSGGLTNGALWDDLNRMRVLVGGDPQSTAGVPSESYLFDVGGNRFARQDRRGYPIITVRDAGGQPLAEYTKKSVDNFPKLDRDFVYGAGKLLVERVVTGVVPHSMGTDPVRTGTAYNFSVDQGAGSGSYDVDIQTGSGYQNYVTGIQLGTGNSFTLAESTLAPNETNFVRIRGANPAITNYSPIVSVVYDPSITSSSQNPVRVLSVSRSGTNVALKWEVAGTTTKRFRVYFRLADGSATYLLSPVSLPSSTRTLTLSDQSLTQVCGDFFVKIVLSDSPLTESAPSPSNRLGSAQSGISGPLNPCGGGSGSNPISYTFANSYHHRDHLGSLRAETDEAGNRSVKRDYYAFGIEMSGGFESSAQAATRRQFTAAERGVYNGLDYMMARFCSGNAGRFLSPDAELGDPSLPQSWNRYALLGNSPLIYIDTDGDATSYAPGEEGQHQKEAVEFLMEVSPDFKHEIEAHEDPRGPDLNFRGASADVEGTDKGGANIRLSPVDSYLGTDIGTIWGRHESLSDYLESIAEEVGHGHDGRTNTAAVAIDRVSGPQGEDRIEARAKKWAREVVRRQMKEYNKKNPKKRIDIWAAKKTKAWLAAWLGQGFERLFANMDLAEIRRAEARQARERARQDRRSGGKGSLAPKPGP